MGGSVDLTVPRWKSDANQPRDAPWERLPCQSDMGGRLGGQSGQTEVRHVGARAGLVPCHAHGGTNRARHRHERRRFNPSIAPNRPRGWKWQGRHGSAPQPSASADPAPEEQDVEGVLDDRGVVDVALSQGHNRAMPDLPVTRFARHGDVHIAYQVFGSGSVDLLFVDDWVHHVEMVWDIPEFARFLRRLGSFARVIHFDRRGTGLSDPVPIDALPDLETQVEDAIAVLDAAGSESAAILGIQVGGLIAMVLAADHPERCRALILYAASAMASGGPDHPLGATPEALDATIDQVIDSILNDPGGLEILAPSHAGDQRFIDQLARLQRSAVRPGTVGHFLRQSLLTDLRPILPAIAVPTLVLHRSGDGVVPVELGREVAGLIPGATLRELDGADHLAFAGDSEALVDEIEEFLTGARGGADTERVLATLLFTDIVGSTAVAARLGDQRWHDLLDVHRARLRREFLRFKGRELATTGDGFLAAFDGAARAVRCAEAIASDVSSDGLQIRAGVHAGEIDLRGSDASGLSVHIAARIAALAEPGEVLVSSTVRDLLIGSGFDFVARGEYALKGAPDRWRLFAVSRAPAPAARP